MRSLRMLTYAIRKAYMAATMRRDTIAFRDGDNEAGKTLAYWGDPDVPGGRGSAARDGQRWGGVGVRGNMTGETGSCRSWPAICSCRS